MESNLTCSDVKELIANDLDRELTEPMQGRLRAHLQGCAGCRSDASSLSESLECIRIAAETAAEATAPESWFAERTLDRLLAELPIDPAGENDSVEAGQLELWR